MTPALRKRIRLLSIVSTVTGLAAIAALTWIGLGQSELTKVERQVHVIHHNFVTFPCSHGNDAKCRAFIAALLSRATKHQLEALLKAKGVTVTPRVARKLRRIAKGVVPHGHKPTHRGRPGRLRR